MQLEKFGLHKKCNKCGYNSCNEKAIVRVRNTCTSILPGCCGIGFARGDVSIMGLEVCVLASGSSGNCTYVSAGSTRILVDAGLSARETVRRLEQIGVHPENLDAICFSHEHRDHTVGLKTLHKKYGIPLFANAGTVEGITRDLAGDGLQWNVFATGSRFKVGEMNIEAFAVSHDAYEPVGFVISNGAARLGVATDMGTVTHLVREKLKHCHALILESNHDEDLLEQSARPWFLKQRIRGRQGHLSNRAAADVVGHIAGPHLGHVFPSHVSRDCNTVDIARNIISTALETAGFSQARVISTFPDRISELVKVFDSDL